MKSFHLLTAIGLLVSSITWAGEKATVPPPAETGPAQFVVTPDSLRVRMLESNLSVMQALNTLKDSNDKVAQSRGQLLPSLSLAGVIGAVSGTFISALSSVQFLLPFLSPSNWANYNAQKAQFQADKYGYYITELNLYSAALSAFYAAKADWDMSKVYKDNADSLNAVAVIASGQVQSGTADADTLVDLQTAAINAAIKSSQLAVQANNDLAYLRRVLAFPTTTQLVIGENSDLAPSPYEANKNVEELVETAFKIAPEHLQVKFLIDNAKSFSTSAKFSWINNFTLTAQGNSATNQSASFQHLLGGGGATFGFYQPPTISLAERNVEEKGLIDTDIRQTIRQNLDQATFGIREQLLQLSLALSGEANAQTRNASAYIKFRSGAYRFADLWAAIANYTQQEVYKVQALEGVNLQRVIFHRTFLTDVFAKIKGCGIDDNKSSKKQPLEAICRSH